MGDFTSIMVLKAIFFNPGSIIIGILILCGFISVIIGKRIGYRPRSPIVRMSTKCFMMGFLLGPVGWLVLLYSWRSELHLKKFQSLISALDNQDDRKNFNQEDIAHFIRLLSFYIKIFKHRNIIGWLRFLFILIGFFCVRLGFGFIAIWLGLIPFFLTEFLLFKCAIWLSAVTNRAEIDFLYGGNNYFEYYFLSRRSGELLNPVIELLHKLQEKKA